jgi:hypothetical protein
MSQIKDHPNALLLVEGKNDFHVIHALCKQFDIPIRNKENSKGGVFSVVDCESIDKLLPQIHVRFKTSIKTMGIIVDADNDIKNRWVSLQNIIQKEGFNVPTQLPKEGLILENMDGNKIGIWIMPNNEVNGIVEDFITFLVPTNDPLLPVVESTLSHIENKQWNNYSLTHKAKAKIHTWLAWQEIPGIPMGLAITSKYLNTDEDICNRLINWLQTLFCSNTNQ